MDGIPVFYGTSYQRGYGLGSLLRPAFKLALPLFKRGAIALGKRVLRTGLKVGADILAGRPPKEAFKHHAKAAGKALLREGINTARGMGRAQLKRRVGRDIFDSDG